MNACDRQQFLPSTPDTNAASLPSTSQVNTHSRRANTADGFLDNCEREHPPRQASMVSMGIYWRQHSKATIFVSSIPLVRRKSAGKFVPRVYYLACRTSMFGQHFAFWELLDGETRAQHPLRLPGARELCRLTQAGGLGQTTRASSTRVAGLRTSPNQAHCPPGVTSTPSGGRGRFNRCAFICPCI